MNRHHCYINPFQSRYLIKTFSDPSPLFSKSLIPFQSRPSSQITPPLLQNRTSFSQPTTTSQPQLPTRTSPYQYTMSKLPTATPQQVVASSPTPPKPSRVKTLLPISAAALVTAAVMYPVDVLRALKMASASGPGYTISEFIKVHGLKGVMTQGLGPEITRATWMRILKFFFFPITFELMWGKSSAKGEWYEKGLAGVLAVVPEVMTITTLELAKIGLQLDSEKRFNNNTMALVRYVHSQSGIAGLMAGWQGVQLRQSLWTGTYFASLDFFKRLTRDTLFDGKSTSDNQKWINFLAGFGAGCLGAAANTPFDLNRTILQKTYLQELYKGNLTATPTQYAFSFPTYFKSMANLVQTKGIRTLYNGFSMKALHMGGSGACVAVLIPQFAKMFGMSPEGLM